MLPCLFLAVTIIAAEQLRSFCRKIRRQYYRYHTIISCFLQSRTITNDKSILSANYVCLRGMQESQSDPARTHRHRRPPSCMIVTAMIVTVSPTRLGYDWREPLHEHGATIETKHLNSCSHKTTFELSLIITVVKIKLSFRFTKRRLKCLAARDPLWREKSAWH